MNDDEEQIDKEKKKTGKKTNRARMSFMTLRL